MTTTTSVRKTIAIDQQSVLRIYDGEGMRLTPASGVLWITEERSANDTVLLPGDTHRLEKPGLTLVCAHGAARVVMELPAGTAAPRRVDFASAMGAIGRRVPFPTRGWASLSRWVRAVGITIRRAVARHVAEKSYRMWHNCDGSRRVHPSPYY